MTNTVEDTGGEVSGFHRVQPERDLESNWEVDLALKLEEYLLKICSGEIHPCEDDGHIAVNFAEAALLLQGSVQVYSRKVEYLYSLVLRALEFLSQKRQQDQLEGTSTQPEEGGLHNVADDENDLFWSVEDIAVEPKNCLDSPTDKDSLLFHFVKPPANLVVLEGDCLDTTGDGTELDSYLLATNDLYQDFILLDPCDATVVEDFLKRDKVDKGHNGVHRGNSTRKSFLSPTRRSAGTAHKSSLGRSQDAHVPCSPLNACRIESNNCNDGPDPPAPDNFNDIKYGFDMDDRYPEPSDLDDSDDDNDPWKPLNPHEPGNLKIKPFRKVGAFKRCNANRGKGVSITTLFPLAKLNGTISQEFTKMWEIRHSANERQRESSLLYDKLRHSLINGGHETCDAFCDPEDENEDRGYDDWNGDWGQPDVDMHDKDYMDEDVSHQNEKHADVTGCFGNNEAFEHDCPNSNASLEDLCRSHLDALLASIAESEKQTELAARVSTWKQKIEDNLEEQESRPAFDIHDYGGKILDKLSSKADKESIVSFSDVVKGQEMYDVARSFSALLQLVNNGDVELNGSQVDADTMCHTAVNPFHIRLLSHDKQRAKMEFQNSRKSVKSPAKKRSAKYDNHNKVGKENIPSSNFVKEDSTSELLSQPNGKLFVKVGKNVGVRCTPESKRRRRSRFIEPVNLHSAG